MANAMRFISAPPEMKSPTSRMAADSPNSMFQARRERVYSDVPRSQTWTESPASSPSGRTLLRSNSLMQRSTFDRRSAPMRGMSSPCASPAISPKSPKMVFLMEEQQEDLKEPFLPVLGNDFEVPISDAASSNSYREDVAKGLVYGVVNYVVCVPTLVSYAQIVFNEPEFVMFFPLIVKLYYLSSAVIQLVFCLRSGLEFAVGQIQDVGLILLSAMVRTIVAWGRKEGISNEEMTATSLWLCALSTIIVGVCVILVGKLKLSEYVQMIPLPVVGGYLGYIGYFCIVAGLQITSGIEFDTPDKLLKLCDLSALSQHEWRLARQLALLSAMSVCMLTVHFKVKHFMGMPIMLLVLPILFFVALPVVGVSLTDCRDNGWLQPALEPSMGYQVYGLYDMSKVRWDYLPSQFTSVIGLVLVVSFGSSLDVAAVQEARPSQKLDYNNELITVGLSNTVSGLIGGATGSYIFSQTVFSAKRNVRSRSNGYFVCVGELALFLLPFDIVQYLPNAYIGACMVLFGVDICFDWMICSRSLMAPIEYALVWLSFAVVMWLTAMDSFGVIEGMGVSTLVAAFVFSVRYARTQGQWEVIRSQSSVVRPWRERKALSKVTGSILSVGLSGYAFFFSSLGVTHAIEEEARRRRPRIVCLDFGRLQGLDSTAAAQLKYLVNNLERENAQVLLSNVHSPAFRRLLEVQGLVPLDPADDLAKDNSRPVFETLDAALRHCEETFLMSINLQPRSAAVADKESPLDEILLEYVEGFSRAGGGQTEHDVAAAQGVAKYFNRIELQAGDVIFDSQEFADAIYVVTAGSLRVSATMPQNDFTRIVSPNKNEHVASPRKSVASNYSGATFRNPPEVLGKGTILGDTAYYVRRSFGSDAVANVDNCVVHQITRRTIEELEVSKPALVGFLQKVLLRDLTQYQVQFLEPTMLASGVV